MSSIISSLRRQDGDGETSEESKEFSMTYRHWFVISLLILMNVAIFGCVFLAAFGRVRLGF
jgi:hypothetical protein